MGLLKIALPLVAVLLLGTVIFWRQQEDLGIGISFSNADIEAMRSGLVVTGPRLSGASATGDLFDFRAERVEPHDLSMKSADVSTLTGRISFRDGRVVTVESETAEIDIASHRILLETGVRVTTSNGYEASATRVTVDTAVALLTADGPVVAEGPLGRIEAGAMTIEASDPDRPAETAAIRFTGGVTLRYKPSGKN